MAANTVGHAQTDHLRTMALVEAAAWFAIENLQKGGAFVAKVFAGGTDHDLLSVLKKHFTTIKHAKPPASRKGSSERSEEHTSELQSLMRISYAVFCLKKKKKTQHLIIYKPKETKKQSTTLN